LQLIGGGGGHERKAEQYWGQRGRKGGGGGGEPRGDYWTMRGTGDQRCSGRWTKRCNTNTTGKRGVGRGRRVRKRRMHGVKRKKRWRSWDRGGGGMAIMGGIGV